MSDLAVRCLQPSPKAASLTVPVPSHCDWRTLLRWQQANWRGFGDSVLRRPHQSTDRQFGPKVSWCREPLSAATCKALCRPKADRSPPGNRGELTCSRPAEAVPQKAAKWAQRIVLWLLGYTDWGFPCFSSVVRQMPGYNSKGARPAFSHSCFLPKSQRLPAQAIPDLLGWTPRRPSNQNPFHKGQIALWDNLPPVKSATSLKISSVSATTKPRYRKHISPLQFKATSTISNKAFRTQQWYNIARQNVSRMLFQCPDLAVATCKL
jgi:hypothetical protein